MPQPKRSLLPLSSGALVALAALASLGSTGCSKKETVDSIDIATHGMALDYKLVCNGTTTSVQIGIHVGDWDSNDFVQLSSGDKLILRQPGPETSGFAANQSNGRTIYQLEVPATSGDFVLDFTRTKAASALGNKITLPPPFNITAPTATSNVSRKNNLAITWDAPGSGYAVDVKVSGSCIFDVDQNSPGDAGSVSFNAGQLKSLSGHEADTCPLTISVMRKTSSGVFSGEFGHASQADGEQLRSVTVTSTP